MGHQLYSGNLSAFMSAKKLLNSLGCEVYILDFYDDFAMEEVMHVKVYMPGDSSTLLDRTLLAARDIDVLYNKATEYMNNLAKQLAYWK